jgi:hypothetical protein
MSRYSCIRDNTGKGTVFFADAFVPAPDWHHQEHKSDVTSVETTYPQFV